MARLPDIPHDLWIEDQQQQFQRRVGGMLPALEFEDAISGFNAENISPDWPVPGGADNEEEERRLLEEQRRQAEEAKARQEEYDRLYASQWDEYQRQLQEQDVLLQQSQAEASAAGIPSPDDFLGDANRLANQPGWQNPDDDASPVLAQGFLEGTQSLGESLGIPSPDQFMSSLSDIGSRLSSGWNQSDEPTTDWAGNPTEAQPIQDVPFMETGLGKDIASVGGAIQGAADASGGYLGAAANIASTPVGGQLGESVMTGAEQLPVIGGPIAGARRALDTAADYLSTPETPEQKAAVGTAQKEILRAPLQFIGSTIDILAGDPKQEIRHKDPWGVMDALGIEEGVTKGDIIANVAPVKILNMPQWLDVAAQLVDNPGETTAGLAAIGGLGRLLGMGPWGQRAALSIIGGIAGGIDSAVSKRDIVGGDGSGYTASDLATEVAGGAALGLGGTVGAQKGLPAVARLIKTIAGSETMGEALGYIDQLATKVVDDVAESISPKYPAVGQAIRNVQPTSAPAAGQAETLARTVAPGRGMPGSVAGGVTGAVTGFTTAPEDATMQERLGRGVVGGLVGTPLGRFAATEGTIAGGKLLDSLINRGAVDVSILDTHPPTAERIRALFLMAAGDKADDAVVDVPYLASYLVKTTADVQQQVTDLMQPGITAGQIRASVRNPTTFEATAQAASEIVSDLMLGVRNRAARQGERISDDVAINGMPQSMRYAIIKDAAQASSVQREGLDTRMGRAVRTTNEDVTSFVKSVADELGIPAPDVFILNHTTPNASLTYTRGHKPGVILTKGLIDTDLTEDEIRAVIKHELGHWGQKAEGIRHVVPPQVVGQMTNIPVRQEYPEYVHEALRYIQGAITPEGIRLHVSRAQGRDAAGGRLMRNAVFYEAVPPEQVTSYYHARTVNEGLGAVGGDELIPATETVYRNPLIMIDRDPSGNYQDYFDNGFAQLGIRNPEAGRWVVDDGYGQLLAAETFDTPEQALKWANEGGGPKPGDYDDSTALFPSSITRAGREITPIQLPEILTQDYVMGKFFGMSPNGRSLSLPQMQEFLSRFGGDPDSADLLIQALNRGQPPSFAINENILATNARRQGHDAVFNIEGTRSVPSIREIISLQEGKNPVPAPHDPTIRESMSRLHEQVQSTEEGFRSLNNFVDETIPRLVDNDPDVNEAFTYGYKLKEQRANELLAMSDELEELRTRNISPESFQGRAGYSIHPEIETTPGTVRQTFEDPVDTPARWIPEQNQFGGALAGAGAASESLDPDEDDWRTSIGTLAGGALFGGAVLRRNQLGKVNFGPNDPKTEMFKKGPVRDALTNPTIFESARNFWTEKMTDQLSRLQGYQNDIAREFQKQTGKLIPAASLAAELKRIDPNREAEMLVDKHMKPALLTLQRLGFDEDTIDSFLAYTHDVDVAKYIANYNNTGLIDDTRIFPGGMTGMFADSQLADFYSKLHANYTPAQIREFNGAIDQIWSLGDEILKIKRDAGLIKPEVYTELRKIYPHYIPTNILAYISDDANVSVGKSLSVAGNTINALSREGTEKGAMGSVAALLSATYEATAAANRNKVFNAFLGMWSNAAHLDQQIPTKAADPSLSRGRERVHEFANLIRPKWNSKATQSGEWVPLQGFINGQKIRFEVHQDLGDVTKYESVPTVPIMSGLAAAFRAGATSRNPVFLTANAFLDWYTYMVRETARGGGGIGAVGNALGAYGEALGALLLTPQAWKDIASHEYSGNVRQALSEGMGYSGLTPGGQYTAESMANRVSQDPFQKKLGELLTWMGYEPKSAAEQETARLRRDIGLTTGAGSIGGALAGGIAGHTSAPDDATPGDRFSRTAGGAAAGFLTGGAVAGRIEARSAADIVRVMKDLALLKPVEAVGERIELVPRVAARQLARNRHQDTILTLSKERAQAVANPSAHRPVDLIERELRDAQLRQTIEGTTAGRTTTIDFNKGGTWAKAINSVIPFFNVGMQALADGQRAWDEKGWVYGGTLLNMAVMPAVFAEVLNHRDQETIDDYNDVPQYMKDQGVIFMLPKQAFPPVEDDRGNLHPQFLHLRYRQLAPLAIMTRKIMQDTIFQPANMKDPTWPETVGSMLLSQSPLQATNPADAALGLATPALGTAVQLAFGRDTFRDRNIVSERADKQASPLSQALAERFGFDNEYMKRPATWDFLTRDLFSGYANAWHGASEMLYGKQKPPSRQDMPVVGGLYGRFVKGSIGEEARRASDNLLTPSALEILNREKITWRPEPTDPAIQAMPLTRREQGVFQNRINEEIDKLIHEAPTYAIWNTWNPLQKKEALMQEAEKRRDLVRGEMYRLVQSRIGNQGMMDRVKKRVDEGEILPPKVGR